MTIFQSAHGRDRLAWYMYDVGNTALEFSIALYLTRHLILDGGMSPRSFGWAFGVSSWLAALSAPHLGYWADQLGHRRAVYLVTSTLCGLSIASLTLLPLPPIGSLQVIVLACMIGNVSFHLSNSQYNSALIAASHSKGLLDVSARGTALSYIGALSVLALLQLPGLRTWPLPMASSSSGAFLPVAALFLFLAAPAGLSPRLWEPRTSDPGGSANAQHTPGSPIALLRAQPERLATLIAYALVTAAITGFTLFLPTQLQAVARLTPFTTTRLLIAAAIAAALGAGILPALPARLRSPALVLRVAIPSWALAILALGTIQTPGSLWILVPLQASFAAASVAALRPMISSCFPRASQSTAFGITTFAHRLAAGTGAILLPTLTPTLSTAPGMAVSASTMAILALAALPLLRKCKPERSS